MIAAHITNMINITGSASTGNNNPNVPIVKIPMIRGNVISCDRTHTAKRYNPQMIRNIQNPNTCMIGAIIPSANPYMLKFPVALKFCNQYLR
jgi:hypothetical protein